MKLIKAGIILALQFFVMKGTAMNTVNENAESVNEIRTYLAFTLPIDPANVLSLVDLDMSYALGITLVDWSSSRDITSALAESWEFKSENEIEFKIKKNALWSDGSPITAQDYVKSLSRAKTLHGEDLKSFFDLIESVQAKGSKTVAFKVKTTSVKSGLIKKITEPMYGLVAIATNGELDLKKSAGPYRMVSVSENELTLEVNKNWVFYEPKMIAKVTIRRPINSENPSEILIKDKWPNLMMSFSLSDMDTFEKMKSQGLTFWNRNLDRILFMAPNQADSTPEGRKLIQFLNQKMNRNELTNGFTGYQLETQFFPAGYVLHSPDFKPRFNSVPPELPSKYKKEPIVFLAAESRLDAEMIKNLKKTIKNLTGVEPIVKLAKLNKFKWARKSEKYDVLIASISIGDPNYEGTVGFVFGQTPPYVPNAGINGSLNFRKQIDQAMHLEDSSARALIYKKVFTAAIEEGCLLPLFHYSSMVLTKKGLDLSHVPKTDEAISFAKVRIKE